MAEKRTNNSGTHEDATVHAQTRNHAGHPSFQHVNKATVEPSPASYASPHAVPPHEPVPIHSLARLRSRQCWCDITGSTALAIYHKPLTGPNSLGGATSGCCAGDQRRAACGGNASVARSALPTARVNPPTPKANGQRLTHLHGRARWWSADCTWSGLLTGRTLHSVGSSHRCM